MSASIDLNALFDQMDAPTAAAEGAYSNDPADSGGETNWGITVAVARENGYTGPMASMTRAQAKAIRKSKYFLRSGVYLIAPLSLPIATELYDTGINMGVGTAGGFLQRCLNVFNNGGTDYQDVTVDMQVGGLTVSALTSFLRIRGDLGRTVLLRALNSLQGEHYISLAETRPKDERFSFGWFAKRIGGSF